MSRVQQPKSSTEFYAILRTLSNSTLQVRYFSAQWCAPCHAIKPAVESLSRQYPSIAILKIDVDACQEVAQQAQVSSIPAFHFWIHGKKVDELIGANPRALEQKIMANLPKNDPSQGIAISTATEEWVSGQRDITPLIQFNQVECLNQSTKHPLQNIFKDDATYLESDVDEQLLIHLTFRQHVNIHTLRLKLGSIPNAPKRLVLFANPISSISFESAESEKFTQEIVIEEKWIGKDGVVLVPLKYVKFQRLLKLTLFIVDNQGEQDVTRLDRLWVLGNPVDTTNMSNLQKSTP